MKFSKQIFIAFILLIGISLVISSCDKTITDPVKTAYLPASLDATAGNWKTYILTKADEIAIAEPKAVTDAAYKKELDSLKTSVLPKLTAENKSIVNFWGAGAVYRWNEIARELAAKYNLAPAANAEGKYPVPDAANPLAEPRFPFANPPYTARALAYLNVAQYDALVATWKYKYKYNRKAPSKNDAAIIPLLPVSDLPSYPSEDAVVAGASYTILAAMFPGEVPYLKEKLAEAETARLWAGTNVRSDITAGDALGKAVGAKIMARAKADGMSTANNQALTAGFIDGAKARGIKDVWVSQENPARPPMLPNYGAVMTWNFDKATLSTIRPKLPYIVGSAEWNTEKAELEKINKSQTRDQAKIASYWSDGAGSYTPPGHWARTASDLCFENKFSEVATARTMALVTTAMMDAGIACWETKYYYYTPRPQQFGIKTSVGLPNFPSYTSGHSTFSAAAATVLGQIFPTKASELNTKAKEASESRIFGLIHFRTDCEMGLVHGKKIGEYAVAKGKADGSGL
jgi:PAP2 superfamily